MSTEFQIPEGSTHHVLKLYVEYFQPLVDGHKKSEARFDDREYQIGDTVELREGEQVDGEFIYTGRSVSGIISFISIFGMQLGWVDLSLSRVGMLVVAPPTEGNNYVEG